MTSSPSVGWSQTLSSGCTDSEHDSSPSVGSSHSPSVVGGSHSPSEPEERDVGWRGARGSLFRTHLVHSRKSHSGQR